MLIPIVLKTLAIVASCVGLWLYVDYPLLSAIAEANGLHAELIAEGEHYDYLARLTNS